VGLFCATSALVLMYLRQNVGQTGRVDMYGVSRPTVSRITARSCRAEELEVPPQHNSLLPARRG